MSVARRAARLLESGTAWAGLAGDALAWVLGDVAKDGRWLVIVDEPDAARRFVDAVRYFHPTPDRVLLLPADDVKPYDGFSPDRNVVHERIRTLHRVDGGGPVLVVAPAAALLRRVASPAVRRKGTLLVEKGGRLDRDALVRHLQDAGYLGAGHVDGPGMFAVRGDLVDVWGAASTSPIRIDFWDDEVEALHRFDPATHRPTKKLDKALFLPAREERLDDDARARLRLTVAPSPEAVKLRRRVIEDVDAGLRFAGVEDWLPALVDAVSPLAALGDLRRIVVHPPDVAASLREHQRRVRDRYDHTDPGERPLVTPADRYDDVDDVLAALSTAHRVVEYADEGSEDLGTRPADGFALRGAELGPVVSKLYELAGEDVSVGIVADSPARAERIAEMMAAHDLNLRSAASIADLRPGRISMMVAPLLRGFVAEPARLALVTAGAMFGGGAARARKLARNHQLFEAAVADPTQLRPGDHVVHRLHGIGLFRGLTRVDTGDVEQDFAKVEYRNQELLYVPITRLDELSPYTPSHKGADVVLDRLGGATWAARKAKVRDSVLAAANELLRIQAHRELATRPPLPPAGALYREFERNFPFDETPDQAQAIAAVLDDLTGDRPMDRLVCGDVGFGKTEVALRAAMRFVEAGRQVAVMCPTTVLAYQHGQRFAERFAGLPVTVKVLSRFTHSNDEKSILHGLRHGSVDIVVGTHRLLGSELKFKDLGLLVIDEEHRFGVKQKEKLKKLRSSVDVLTMSATPIPRTLEMALSGLREMSLVTTPPQDRLAVRTTVARPSWNRIQDAVQQELARQGQVFFVHNRVETIEVVAKELTEHVPEARVAFAHGQLDPDKLEEILVRFIDRKVDVLVTTAIIESGVDLPNVNTMIVDRADQFGLAQLHQLRGRVGRGSTRGSCILLAEEDITPEARRRLRVIVENSSLGAGFRIASEDLEMRGGGNLLGESQHGSIDAVGYDTWVELLAEAVREARGELERSRVEPEIEVPIPAFLPEDYVRDVDERLSWYRRIAGSHRPDELDEVEKELEGWFGEPPAAVQNVVGLAQIRIACRELGVTRLRWLKVRVVLDVHPKAPIPASRLDLFQKEHPKRVTLDRKDDGEAQLSVRFLPSEAERPVHFLRWLLARLSRDPDGARPVKSAR